MSRPGFFLCLLVSAAALAVTTGRSLIAVAATPVPLLLEFRPTLGQIGAAEQNPLADAAMTLARRLGVEDYRLSGAAFARCRHREATCTPALERARAAAPYDAELPLLMAEEGLLMQHDQRAIARDLSASCRLAEREAWLALQRVAIASALPDDSFEALDSCFSRDIATLIDAPYFKPLLVDFYVRTEAARGRVRKAIETGASARSGAFVAALRKRLQ